MTAKTILTVGILVCMALGLALAGWLFVVNNAGAVFRAFAAVGWGLAAVVFRIVGFRGPHRLASMWRLT